MSSRAGYSERSRIDKLGVKAGAKVAVVGLDDAEFDRELVGRTPDVSHGPPRRGTDMIFFAVTKISQLGRLATLRRALQPAGAIWVLWPKGRPALREDDVRAAALRVDLVDVKVAAFSSTLSALKLVIPVAKRPR